MGTTIEELMAHRPEVGFTVELAARKLGEFRERGFTSIERITSDEELASLGKVYDRLFAERVEAVPGGYIDLERSYDSAGEDRQPQILLPDVRFAELRKTAFWRNAVAGSGVGPGLRSTPMVRKRFGYGFRHEQRR